MCDWPKNLLIRYVNSEQTILVALSNIVVDSKPLTKIVTMDQMQEGNHSLEEPDHQIVPHSTDFAQNDPETILDVYSLDTGVLVLLTTFHAEIPEATTLLRLNNEKLSIPSSRNQIGAEHAEALIGWYTFKGTDNIGGIVSKALKSHINALNFLPATTTSFVLLLPLLMTHTYQTVFSDKRQGISVFSTSQPTVSLNHYRLSSGGSYSPNSAKKESNCHQQRVHWYLIQERQLTFPWCL